MAAAYKDASKILKDGGIKAAVAEVDCTKEKEVCSEQKITGFPTLKIFRSSNLDKPLNYDGGRDAQSIVDYLKRLTLPAILELKPEEIKKHVDGFSSTLVIVANLPKSHSSFPTFEKVADALRMDFSFVHVEGKENSLTIFKNFDEKEVKYTGSLDKLTEVDLTSWIKEENIPLMDEITPNNYEKYINANKPMAYLFYDNDEMRKTYGEIVQKVVKPFKNKISTIFIDAKEYGRHATNLNLEQVWPGFVIHDIVRNHKYPFTGKDKKELNVENLTEFIQKFLDGKIEPSCKSEPIPTDDKGTIKTVVSDNFVKVVLDTSKDVFLDIYAPHCPGCHAIAPEFEKLAELYAKETDKIVFAKIDGIANDLPKAANFPIKQFPTLLLYKAGSNELVEMKEIGEAKKLYEFLQENATVKVTIDAAALEDTKSKSKAEEPSESGAETAAESGAEPSDAEVSEEEIDKTEL